MSFLPKNLTAKAPPIKTQGIKTKLLPMIASNIAWDGEGRWVEPFLGSGAVALNIAPPNAILADTNKHIIGVYRAIQSGELTSHKVRKFLEVEGSHLLEKGDEHYYQVRSRFNEEGSPLDFLFLTRSCFNGVMRFNKKGGFNVPFCKKPNRFRQALVTKICNQVDWAARAISGKDWEFKVQSWQETVAEAKQGDLIYCDPPYVARHTDYYNSFSDEEGVELADALKSSPADFAMSMWLENKYRRNNYVDECFENHEIKTISHFYHVGSRESLRNEMVEALILSDGVAGATPPSVEETSLPLFESAETANV